jgi:hypothetical protein
MVKCVPQHNVHDVVQIVIAEKLVVARAGRRHPEGRESSVKIADAKIVFIRLRDEEVSLRPGVHVRGTLGLLIIGDHYSEFERVIREEQRESGPGFFGSLDDIRRIGDDPHEKSVCIHLGLERQCDAVAERVENRGCNACSQAHVLTTIIAATSAPGTLDGAVFTSLKVLARWHRHPERR